MTDTLKMAREALKPCPHCGLAHTLKLTTAQELAEEGEDDPEPWMHSDSWAVMCDASRPSGPGGCGASGGFYPSEAEAVEAWNRRAAIDAQQAAPTELEQAHEARRHAQREAAELKERMARVRLDLMRELREQGWTPPAQQAATVGEPSEFDHDIGADRFRVVKGAFWWHIRIGDGTANVGKFHSKLAAEDVALKMLTAFRDGAYMQHQRALAATPPAAQAQDAARYQRLRLMARYDDATQTVTFPGLRLGAGSGLPDMLDAGIDGAAAQGGEHV